MRFKSAFITTLGTSFLLACAASAQADDMKKISNLKTPESAVVGSDGRIYVSEIGEFGKDGDGQIGVIDAQGNLKVYASGMDDPKGLALIGKNLYVADKTRILKVKPDGQWSVFAAADAFPVTPQFLNDLEADAQGTLYVSDSGDLKGSGGAVYRISPAGKVSSITDGSKDQRVLGPNGLLMDGNGKLLMVDFVSGILYRIDLANGDMKQLAEGFGGGDGLARDAEGRIYISDWKNGKVFKMGRKGKVHLIKEGFVAAADITMSADGQFVLVPDMKAGELLWLPIH